MSNDLLAFTIAWNVIFIELLVFCCVLVLLAMLFIWFERKVRRQFFLMNYEYVLKHKKLILYINSKSKSLADTYLMLAVSSFEVGEELDFENYVNKANDEKNQIAVLYWKCYFYFFKQQKENFDTYFYLLKNSEESEWRNKYVRTIEILLKKRNGENLIPEELEVINQTVSKKMKEYVNSAR